MSDSDKLGAFVEGLLKRANVQPSAIEWNDDDLLLTFFNYLVSKSILRCDSRHTSYSVFVFSNPGRAIIEDESRRSLFIREFLLFYNGEPSYLIND